MNEPYEEWFQKGWVSCLIEQVAIGARPIAEYKDALFWPCGWEKVLEYISNAAKEKGVKVSIEIINRTTIVSKKQITIQEYYDGGLCTRVIRQPGKYNYKTAVLLFYKDRANYDTYKQWLTLPDCVEKYRGLSKMLGYSGEEEIVKSIRKLRYKYSSSLKENK